METGQFECIYKKVNVQLFNYSIVDPAADWKEELSRHSMFGKDPFCLKKNWGLRSPHGSTCSWALQASEHHDISQGCCFTLDWQIWRNLLLENHIVNVKEET